MLRSIFIALFFFVLSSPDLTQAQSNTVTLTTYYPAPFGAYDRFRLVPRDPIPDASCTADLEGTIYIPNTSYTLQQCRSNAWVPLSGGVWNRTPIVSNNNYFDVPPGIPRPNIDQFTTVEPYPDLADKLPYVGIGTNDPRRPLHVSIKNPNVETVLALENTNATIGSGVGISFRGVDTISGTPFSEIASIKATYNISPTARRQSTLDLGILNGITGNFLNILSLTGEGGGKVGFYTTLPSGLVDITGNGTAIPYFQITTDTTAPDGNVFNVLNSGRVGIGITAPDEILHVNGNIKASTLILTSDATQKKDIAPVGGALHKISQLQGVSFEWKDRAEDTRKHLGVLAQDVEKIFPEAVYGDEGAKGVDYPGLIAPMIEAIKELKTQNEDLTNQVRELKETLMSLQPEPAQ